MRTQYENAREAAEATDDLTLRYVEIQPYKAGGLIERLPLLGARTRGSLRSLACAAPLFTAAQIDAVWTQADTALFPFLATRARFSRIPYVLSTDATTAQVESFAEYGGQATGGATRLKHRLRDAISAYCYRHAAYVLPWSHWAGRAIHEQFGVPEERIRVIPPGVHLPAWPAPPAHAKGAADRKTRLLFVGGDWERKGGPLLLDVFRTQLRGRCELHLVTRDAVPVRPDEADITIYSDFGPNDPGLKRLYATCDALVLPTRADCFSLASIEAMASGLPVITSAVGGIPEIVEDGASGWLTPVGDGAALARALEALLADPAQAQAMGRRGRAIVEARFDATTNTHAVFELLRTISSAREKR